MRLPSRSLLRPRNGSVLSLLCGMNVINHFSSREVLHQTKNAAGSIPTAAFVPRIDHSKPIVSASLPISVILISVFPIPPIPSMACSRRSRIGLRYTEDYGEIVGTKSFAPCSLEKRKQQPKSSIKPLIHLYSTGIIFSRVVSY